MNRERATIQAENLGRFADAGGAEQLPRLTEELVKVRSAGKPAHNVS